MFDLYLQSSSASRQPTISNLMFFANPVYRVRCHPNAWHLKAFQWHGWTLSSSNSIFLSEIYQFFVENIPHLHLQSSSASRKWKNSKVVRFADLVHRARRDPSVTLRKFSPDTSVHGLRITKRPAVGYFSIFLFEKCQFLLEIFYFYLESSSASRKWKSLNIVLFADSVHKVRRDPSVTLKKIFFGFFQIKFKILEGNCKMTNGECVYRKTVDYMSRMALEKDDSRRFSVIWKFRVTGNWVAARVASSLEN